MFCLCYLFWQFVGFDCGFWFGLLVHVSLICNLVHCCSFRVLVVWVGFVCLVLVCFGLVDGLFYCYVCGLVVLVVGLAIWFCWFVCLWVV